MVDAVSEGYHTCLGEAPPEAPRHYHVEAFVEKEFHPFFSTFYIIIAYSGPHIFILIITEGIEHEVKFFVIFISELTYFSL